MTTLLKILQSKESYDPKDTHMMNNLYFTEYKNVPQINIGGMVFYELSDLVKLHGLSPSKVKQLNSLKPGTVTKLFSVGKFSAYYAVKLTSQEEQSLNAIKTEEAQLKSVNSQIEAQVGNLLKQKIDLEKKISKMKKSF